MLRRGPRCREVPNSQLPDVLGHRGQAYTQDCLQSGAMESIGEPRDGNTTLKIALSDARARLGQESRRFIELFAHGECSVELYAPRGEDTQQPHRQDELYIVSRGRAQFRRGQEVVECESGDMLFVAAHVPHRFESFSQDFETWVIFFGPEGGSAI